MQTQPCATSLSFKHTHTHTIDLTLFYPPLSLPAGSQRKLSHMKTGETYMHKIPEWRLIALFCGFLPDWLQYMHSKRLGETLRALLQTLSDWNGKRFTGIPDVQVLIPSQSKKEQKVNRFQVTIYSIAGSVCVCVCVGNTCRQHHTTVTYHTTPL